MSGSRASVWTAVASAPLFGTAGKANRGWRQRFHPELDRNNNGLDARPHPGLLPQGEGELFAGSLECRATGLAEQPPASQKSCDGMSSPWGEETGEGGRNSNQEI